MTRLAAALIVVLLCLGVPCASAQTPPTPPPTRDAVAALLRSLEQTILDSDWPAFERLLSVSAEPRRQAQFFEVQVPPGATRVVIQERDRQQLIGSLPGAGHLIVAEMFAEYGNRARVATLRLEVKRVTEEGPDEEWLVADAEVMSALENLYRLSLTSTKQFRARNLTVTAEDLELVLPAGDVFVAETPYGPTGVVLLGAGEMRFHPASETEQGQVRIFAGREALVTPFTAVFLRISPYEFEAKLAQSQLTAVPVEPGTFRRADEIFKADAPSSFHLELGDLTRDAWSLLPAQGDFLAEVHTKKFDQLTYAHSQAEPEDINLFERRRKRNIALYASARRLAERGRFYADDHGAEVDVERYDITLDVQPERQFLTGVAKVTLKVVSPLQGTVTLKLADSLVVSSVTAEPWGRLLMLRVKGQNALVVHLPPAVVAGSEVELTVNYSGRLDAQEADRETVGFQASRGEVQMAGEVAQALRAEPNWLYSNRSFWYPQSTTYDYATARLVVTVPADYACVASGDLADGSPSLVGPATGTTASRRQFAFVATQPLRYLALLVSRFQRVETATFSVAEAAQPRPGEPLMLGAVFESVSLAVDANPRQTYRGTEVRDRTVAAASYYASVIGDYPYPSLTIALVENDLPGGHSPAYMAALNQQLPTSPLQWRSDPSAFPRYSDFFVAHEVAHQWWGQAVGWRNYHEQWLSEGFSQYFAALYARQAHGEEVFAEVLKQMRRWSIDAAAQGPVYLGYRIGHIRNDSRMFRAIVYNKGALVLHMLRRLVGDDVFFGGVRRFYRDWRFKRAGTEDFRQAMEEASGRSLERFFEQWVYGSHVPKLRFSWRTDGDAAVLRFEQVGEVFDVPATATVRFADRTTRDVPVALSQAVTEVRVEIHGSIRSIDLRLDDGLGAEIIK